MKGSVSINPIFQQYSLSTATIYCKKPLIVSDNYRIYNLQNKIQKSIRFQTKSIINACWCQKYCVLMVVTQQGKLNIFTHDLNLITKIPWQSKFSVGATQAQIQQVKIFSNVKNTSFISNRLQWNKGYGICKQDDLIYIWSSKDIFFYNLKDLKIKSKISNLTRKDMSITSVLFNNKYKYTITGLINGGIKIWRLSTQSNGFKQNMLIHSFQYHTKSVMQIIVGKDPRTIISISSDLHLCSFSIQTFQLIRTFNFSSNYTKIWLYNGLSAFGCKGGHFGKILYGKDIQFLCDVTSQIINFDKSFQIQNNYNKIKSVQITLGSNLGFRIRDDQLDSKDLNKTQVQYIYPPLKAKGIVQIINCPNIQNKFYLLVQNGDIYKLRIQKNSGKIQESYKIQNSKDIQQYQLNQKPTYITFLQLDFPQFDSQINQNDAQRRNKNKMTNQKEKQQKILITVGCNKGSIVLLNIFQMENIHTRITYHRQQIIVVKSFVKQQIPYLVSICKQNLLKITKVINNKINCIFSTNTMGLVKDVKSLQQSFSLLFPMGFFQIYQINNEQPFKIKGQQGTDHTQQIISFDYCKNKKLIITSASDNIIKIWTTKKILLYQIYLDEGLKTAIWFRDLQIIFQHNLKIIYFRNIGLQINMKQLQNINQQNQNYQLISLNQSLQQIIKLYNQDNQTKNKLGNYLLSKQLSPVKTRLYSQKKKKLKQTQQNPQLIQKYKKQKNKSQIKQKSFSMTNKKNKQYIQRCRIISTYYQKSKKYDQSNQNKNKVNQPILPKINNKNQDLFDLYMKSKLLNKKVLTRRDITLNRIIMKNIIKQHFGENQIVGQLKLDF